MDTCAMCGIEAEHMPFTIFYNDDSREWELGCHLCNDCARLAVSDDLEVEDKKEDEESEQFHAWAQTQR